MPPATVAVAAEGGDATGVRLAAAAARAARWAVGPERVGWRIAEAKILKLLAKPFEADFEGSAAEARVHGTRAPCSWAFASLQ